jgi:nucleotide-binding universal stress UspA family protein
VGFLQDKEFMVTAVSSFSSSHNATSRRRILVCLDRSGRAEACVRHAISLARTFDGDLTLVHVLQPHQEPAGRQLNDALGWEILRQEARGYLRRLEREVAQALGRPVDVRLEQGRPAERIVDVARELGSELIVLGDPGDDSSAARQLGSTAQQVLAAMNCSVLIAHRALGRGTSEHGPRRILVPLDGSVRTESALPAAVRLAAAHDAELLLVHVVREPISTALMQAAEGLELAQKLATRLEAAARRYLGRLQQQLARQGATAQIVVCRHVNEHQCLLELVERQRVELIVLSAHGSACDSARSFGSVTSQLLASSPVPVLVLQDLPGQSAGRADDLELKMAPPPLRAGYAAEQM